MGRKDLGSEYQSLPDFEMKIILEKLQDESMCPKARLALNNLQSGVQGCKTLLKTHQPDFIQTWGIKVAERAGSHTDSTEVHNTASCMPARGASPF